jgi:glycosyltransferase involved in cell wall biosynthesis
MEETHGWADTVIRRCPIPVVVRLCGPWFVLRDIEPLEDRRLENRHRVEREGIAIRNAAAVTSPSDKILTQTEQYYGPLDCPKEVIRRPIEVKPAADRWALNACDHDLILFVGRFDRIKGADVLLKAFTAIARRRSTLKLLFVGPDYGLTDESGHELSFLEFVDREVPPALRERIQYLGHLSEAEIGSLRRTAYLTVVCSRYETFGNVAIEAMASGCPVVATSVGGIPEFIGNQRSGLLVPPNDPDALAQAIAQMLDSPHLAARLGAQAALDCSNSCDPQKVAQQTVTFYSRVVQSSNNRQKWNANAARSNSS